MLEEQNVVRRDGTFYFHTCTGSELQRRQAGVTGAWCLPAIVEQRPSASARTSPPRRFEELITVRAACRLLGQCRLSRRLNLVTRYQLFHLTPLLLPPPPPGAIFSSERGPAERFSYRPASVLGSSVASASRVSHRSTGCPTRG